MRVLLLTQAMGCAIGAMGAPVPTLDTPDFDFVEDVPGASMSLLQDPSFQDLLSALLVCEDTLTVEYSQNTAWTSPVDVPAACHLTVTGVVNDVTVDITPGVDYRFVNHGTADLNNLHFTGGTAYEPPPSDRYFLQFINDDDVKAAFLWDHGAAGHVSQCRFDFFGAGVFFIGETSLNKDLTEFSISDSFFEDNQMACILGIGWVQDITVTNTHFEHCWAGIDAWYKSNTIIRDSVFTNFDLPFGVENQNYGPIYNSGTMYIEDSTFADNTAWTAPAIANVDTLVLYRTTFTDNVAFQGNGGAIHTRNAQGYLDIDQCFFSGNKALNGPGEFNPNYGKGGAIMGHSHLDADPEDGTVHNMSITRTEFINSEADYRGQDVYLFWKPIIAFSDNTYSVPAQQDSSTIYASGGAGGYSTVRFECFQQWDYGGGAEPYENHVAPTHTNVHLKAGTTVQWGGCERGVEDWLHPDNVFESMVLTEDLIAGDWNPVNGFGTADSRPINCPRIPCKACDFGTIPHPTDPTKCWAV